MSSAKLVHRLPHGAAGSALLISDPFAGNTSAAAITIEAPGWIDLLERPGAQRAFATVSAAATMAKRVFRAWQVRPTF